MNHWKKHEDKRWLSMHPLCTRCERQGRYTKATKVIRVQGHLESRCDRHGFDEIEE